VLKVTVLVIHLDIAPLEGMYNSNLKFL